MRIHFKGDYPIYTSTGFVGGYELPTSIPEAEALTRTRLLDNKVVDASKYTTFYIDKEGFKHIEHLDASWQILICNWDDELILEDNSWVIKTGAHFLNMAKEAALENMVQFADTLTENALKKYSKAEQLSFPERLAEANQHQQGVELSDDSILMKLSLENGNSLDDIATAVKQKANEFNQISANVTLIREQGEAAIIGASSIDELDLVIKSLKSAAEVKAKQFGLIS